MASAETPAGLRNDLKERKQTGFFDLPREIRDVIYEYSIIDMRDTRWKEHRPTAGGDGADSNYRCGCDKLLLRVIRARPPYFAHHSGRCLVPDRWLFSVSLVFKQFAGELRPVFFRNTAFFLDSSATNQWLLQEPFGGPLMEEYSAFIHALGPEAKELRRLMVRGHRCMGDPPFFLESADGDGHDDLEMCGGETDDQPSDDDSEGDVVIREADSQDDSEVNIAPNDNNEHRGDDEDSDPVSIIEWDLIPPDAEEAELELEKKIGGLLHRDASVVLVMLVYDTQGAGMFYFDCHVSDEPGRSFVAEVLSTEEGEKYLFI